MAIQTQQQEDESKAQQHINAFNSTSRVSSNHSRPYLAWTAQPTSQWQPVSSLPQTKKAGVTPPLAPKEEPSPQQDAKNSLRTTNSNPIVSTSHNVGPLDAQQRQHMQELDDTRIEKAQGYYNYVENAKKENEGRVAMGDKPSPIMSRDAYNANNPISTQTKSPTDVSGTWTPGARKDWREGFEKKQTEKSERKKMLESGLLALGDSLRHLGNLYYTGKGAIPQQYKYGSQQLAAEREAQEQKEYNRQQLEAQRAYQQTKDAYNMQYQAAKDAADREARVEHNREMEAIARANAESLAKTRGAQADYTTAKTGYLPDEQARKQAESDAKVRYYGARTAKQAADIEANKQKIALAYSKEARISGGGGRSGGNETGYMDVTYDNGTKRVHAKSFADGCGEVYNELVKDGTIKPPLGEKVTTKDKALEVLANPNHPKVKEYTDRMAKAYSAGRSGGNGGSSKGSSKPSGGGSSNSGKSKSSRKVF